MIDALKQCKKAIESLYNGLCTVYEYQEITDSIAKRTVNKEVIVLEKQPCKLSFKNITQSKDGNVSEVKQIIKLFLSQECKINPGSTIVVTQNNVTTKYKNSGQPAIYTNHQEIVLDKLEKA